MGVHSPTIVPVANTIHAVVNGRALLDERQPLDDDSYVPLANVAREISRELQGDGILVTWRDGESEPLILFADGACQPQSAVERDMAAMAASVAQLHSGGPRSQWRARGEGATGAMLTTAVPGEDSVVTITTLFKRIGASTRMQASETAARLLPFIQPFFRLWTLGFKAGARMRGLTAAVNNSDVATMLVGAEGELMFANNAAELLLAHRDGLRRKGGMLTGASLGDTLRLHAAIEQAICPATVAGGASLTPLVALHRASGRPLMASVVATGDPSAQVNGAAAIVYVVDPDRDLQIPLQPACRLYGLSPVEARLACLLANGLSLADAARQMRVRELTARGYLKQIFLKTDTNRQVELVRLLIASAVSASSDFGSQAVRPLV